MKTKIYLLTLVGIFSVKFSSGQVVVLNYFNGAQSSASSIDLTWQSATEVNVNYFAIERSIDSINYAQAGTIKAAGNSSTPLFYLFTDIYAFANTCYYYRLRVADYNGQYQYFSAIKVCYNSASTSIADKTINLFSNIYPNPFSSSTTLQTDNLLSNAILTVDNCFGQTVKQIKNISGQTVALSRDNLASGMYFVRLTEEKKIIAVDKLVIVDK